MCRIFCSPDKELTFTKTHLWKFFKELERSLGKDGNGVYNITTKELWKSAKRMPIEANIEGGLLFHTRYATNGLVRDYNCQPFDNEKYVMVHNGVFTGAESYARLLGFPYSSTKYSDSYMMAWILEKVGVLNFYNALKTKRYGVIVVYEKATDRIYLLKTSGSFECGKFEDGSYIYGSSKIDFWQIEGKAQSINSGLYILSGDGFTQLNKVVTTTYSYGKYSGIEYDSDYYGRGHFNRRQTPATRDNKKPTTVSDYVKDVKSKRISETIKNRFGDGNCVYCGEHIADKDDEYIHYGNKICGDCFAMYNGHVQDDEPIGIGALFPDLLPSTCTGCNWLYEKKCWFGGVERDEPLKIKDGKGVRIDCNTATSEIDVFVNCASCEKTQDTDGNWKIHEELIMCQDCIDYTEQWGRECNNCEYQYDNADIEPCYSCWGFGTPKNWKPKKINDNDNPLCIDCYFEERPTEQEPCTSCYKTDIGMSEWIHKSGKSVYRQLENSPKCFICGWHFETWETPLEDVDDNLVCQDCEEYVDIPLAGGGVLKSSKSLEDRENAKVWNNYKFRRLG